ncbi:MAG: response regulator transcription factor, partial [Bacteroidota bacterium]
MNRSVKILVADDHPLLLKALRDFIEDLGYAQIIEAYNWLDAYHMILREAPLLALLDIRMPQLSGLEVVSRCRTQKSKTRMVLITLHQEKSLFKQAQQLGVYGYLFKQSALAEIETCLKAVIAGERYFSPELEQYFQSPSHELTAMLTPSEKKILRLIAQNYTSPQIAEQLFISTKTVEK